MSQCDLITGATGFTGSALARRLVHEGREVVAFVRPSSNTEALRSLGVACKSVELSDLDSVSAAFESFDRVYHLAAAYRTEHADREEFHRVNVLGSQNMLEAAGNHEVGRFVHVSTVGVQGEIEDPPADENYRYKPGDHYQQSKMEGEQLALQYFSNGLVGTVVRPVGIYGPGDRRFLKLFRLIARGRFTMVGDGKTLYHMTYVEDLIDGILKAAQREEAVGEVFTIAGENYTTLWELVDLIGNAVDRRVRRWHIPLAPVLAASVVCEKICRPLGVNPPLYPRRVEFFRFDRAFAIEKAKQRLGYQPRISLEDGLHNTARWYREQDWI